MRTLFALLLTAGLAAAADAPLEATLDGTTKYTLDLGGQTADEFTKSLKGDKVPPSPKVDLKLVLKNTSKEDIQVWTAGDPVVVTFTLKGKGAESAKPRLAFTQVFRLPKAVTVEAGKKGGLPINLPPGGFRGASEFNYWTQPGEYELTATITTGVSPKPKGADDAGDGFGQVSVASKPLKITVEEKK